MELFTFKVIEFVAFERLKLRMLMTKTVSVILINFF